MIILANEVAITNEEEHTWAIRDTKDYPIVVCTTDPAMLDTDSRLAEPCWVTKDKNITRITVNNSHIKSLETVSDFERLIDDPDMFIFEDGGHGLKYFATLLHLCVDLYSIEETLAMSIWLQDGVKSWSHIDPDKLSAFIKRFKINGIELNTEA